MEHCTLYLFRYHFMRQNIATRYADIEKQLVDKFYEALSASDVKRMRLYASTLQNFPEVRYFLPIHSTLFY